jgi:hypothetical protein
MYRYIFEFEVENELLVNNPGTQSLLALVIEEFK